LLSVSDGVAAATGDEVFLLLGVIQNQPAIAVDCDGDFLY